MASPAGILFAERVRRLINVVVPPLCLVCDAVMAEDGGCCARCWSRIRFIGRPYCEILGIPFSHDHGEGAVSAQAIADPPPFGRLRSAVLYDRHAGRLVRQLKYSDRQNLAPWMARWMIAAGAELLSGDPLIIPIPLHPSRLRQRRFNQSAELSRHIASGSGSVHAPQALARIRRTRQQVGLPGNQRELNVRGAFRVPDQALALVSGRKIVLVDDVYTSGATVKAACRALKRAGVASIDVLTFARVETPGP